MKRVLGVLLLALSLNAGAQTVAVPATALAPAWDVALPFGSQRLEPCALLNEARYCYSIPMPIEILLHSFSTQLRVEGYQLLEERAIDTMVEFGFEMEGDGLLMIQEWYRVLPRARFSIQYAGSSEGTRVSVLDFAPP